MELIPYTERYKRETIDRMLVFFGFHASLMGVREKEDAAARADCAESLLDWTAHPSALYVILHEDADVGFLRLAYRGPQVAWIEDVFVDDGHRGKGLASAAITAAEEIVRAVPGYEAVCMDVVPRNADALRLYHRLGYRDLSLITIRKELGESRRDRPIRLLGYDFHY